MTTLEALRRCYARGARLRIADGVVEGAGADTVTLSADLAYVARAVPLLDYLRDLAGDGPMRYGMAEVEGEPEEVRELLELIRDGVKRSDCRAAVKMLCWWAEGRPVKRAVNT